MKRSLILTAFSFLVLAQITWAQVPQTINYQGVLRDPGTKEIVPDGNYYVTFSIYDVLTETTPVWTSGLIAVPVADGVFSVVLGNAPPAPGPLPDPFPSPAWLGIKVDPDDYEMSPRVELTAVPYSLQAGSVSGTDNVFPGSGNVGIGTTTPSSTEQLHIYDAAAALLLIEGEGDEWSYSGLNLGSGANNKMWNLHHSKTTGMENYFFIQEYDGATYSPRLVIQPGGSVGIGTTSPFDMLDVTGNIRINDGDIFLRGGTDMAHGIGWYADTKTFEGVSVGGPVLYGSSGGALGTKAVGENIALYWNQAGNVGIGTMSPFDKLDVTGNIRINDGDIFFRGGTDIAHGLGWYGDETKAFGGVGVGGPVLYGSTGGGLGTSSGTQNVALYWNQAGKVGIGTADPQAKLEVVGIVKADSILLTTAAERWVSIPGMGFHSGFSYYDSSYCIYHNDKYNKRSFYASLNLPHGATIIQFEATIKDTGVDNMTIELVSMDLSAGTVTTIVSKASTGIIGVETLTGVASPSQVVDNRNNTYVVKATWQAPPYRPTPIYGDSDVCLRGVNIKYTVTNPLP